MEALTEREHAYFGPRADKPPGSVAWCWQTIALMQTRWKQKTLDEAGFDALVKELEEHEAWNVVPPEHPYGNIDDLLLAEIGVTRSQARGQIVGQASGSGPKGGRPKTCDSHVSSRAERARKNKVSEWTQSHNDYVAEHRPDLFCEVQIGAMSTDKAYKLAKGEVPEAPFDRLLRTWRHMSREDRIRFVRFVREKLSLEEREELAEELLGVAPRQT